MRTTLRLSIWIGATTLSASLACAATWIGGGRFHSLNEIAVKEPRVCASKDGGFHLTYRREKPAPFAIRYAHYKGGRFTEPVNAHTLGFLSTGDVAEAGNGDIWLLWENWTEEEQLWAARSTDKGVNWTKYQVTNHTYSPGDWNGHAKSPTLSPFGPANSPNMLACSIHVKFSQLYHSTFNGASWTAHVPSGIGTDNRYAAFGLARHPDGSVYRTYARQISGQWQLCFRRFDGSAFGSEVVVSQMTGGRFVARPAIAINEAGQILTTWDDTERVLARFFDPVSGWGPQTQVANGHSGGVTAVPGRNDFYIACSGENLNRAQGRHVLNGVYAPANDNISVGMPNMFTVNVDVACDPNGVMLCTYEVWPSGEPQGFFSVSFDFATADQTPPLPTFTATPTVTFTVTPTATITNTPRPTRTNTPPGPPPSPSPHPFLVTW